MSLISVWSYKKYQSNIVWFVNIKVPANSLTIDINRLLCTSDTDCAFGYYPGNPTVTNGKLFIVVYPAHLDLQDPLTSNYVI